jgi:hypothetical protein
MQFYVGTKQGAKTQFSENMVTRSSSFSIRKPVIYNSYTFKRATSKFHYKNIRITSPDESFSSIC